MLPPKRCTRSTRLSSKAKAKEELVNTVEGISKDAAETSLKEDPKSKTSETGVKSKHLSTEWDGDQTLKVKGNSIKRVRRSLTNDQRKALEYLAEKTINPTIEERRELAKRLGLQLRVVSSWFQNRRRPSAKISDTNLSSAILLKDRHDNVLNDILNLDTPAYINHSEALIKFPSFSPANIPTRNESRPSSWDLPSTPTPLQRAHSPFSYSSSSELIESPVLAKKRLSLEWACENDTRKKKRIRTGLELGLLGQSLKPRTSRRIRPRTDSRPLYPSPLVRYNLPSVTAKISQVLSLMGPEAKYLDENDIEAAIILIQMRGQKSIRRLTGRKSV